MPTLHAKLGTLAWSFCNGIARCRLESVRSLAASFVLTVALAACGTAGDLGAGTGPVAPAQPITPQSRCEALQARRLSGDSLQLVAAFESTALEIAAWHESGLMPGGGHAGPGQSPLRSHAPDESIASCYFDGSFRYRGHVPYGATPPVFERMLFLVDSTGYLFEEHGGTKKLFPLVRPAA